MTNEVKHPNNWKMFSGTIYDLSHSQGFYSRLREIIENKSADELLEMENKVNNLDIEFKQPVDVVLYLEQ